MNAMRVLAVAAVAFALVEARAEAVSSDGSTLTPAQTGASLTNNAGTWTFGTARNVYGNTVLLNGGANGGFATLLEVANGGQLYAQASDGSWWLWNNPGWSGSQAPPTAVSPDGSMLTITQSQGGSSLGTSAGRWTFGTASNVYGNTVLLNGSANGGFAVLLEVANGGQLYAEASDGSWWRWNNPGWSSSAAPTTGATAITGVTFNWSSHRREAQGSDNWPATWSSNDKQYAIWGDGGGFGGGNDPTTGRSPIGVAEITEDYNNYTGNNVYGGAGMGCSATTSDGMPHTINGKSHGAPLSLGGILYAWITPGSAEAGYDHFALHRSLDDACHWTEIGVTFYAANDHIVFGGFVQFGKDNGAAIDGYLYIVATAAPTGSDLSSLNLVQKAGNVMLLRVPATSIDNRAAYEFFKQLDPNGQPIWSSNPSDARAIYHDDAGVGPFAQMSYVPGVGRFVYTNQHGNGVDASAPHSLLTMAEAPRPWGPWTKFYRDVFPPRTALTPTQSLTGGSLRTSAGTWTFGTTSNPYGNAVLLNGSMTAGYATLLQVVSGQLYAQAGDRSWWRWNNPGWSASAAPTVSADGSTLTFAQSQAGSSLRTSAGTWTLAAGNTVLLNGGATGGYATLLEVSNGGLLYAQASDTSWWRWNGAGWSPSPGPIEETLFQWNFAPKWFRDGGRSFTLIFTGGPGSNDSWNTVDGAFTTSP